MKITSPHEMTYKPPQTGHIVELIEAELAQNKTMQNIGVNKYRITLFIPYKINDITPDERYAIINVYRNAGWDSVTFDTGSNTSITKIELLTEHI